MQDLLEFGRPTANADLAPQPIGRVLADAVSEMRRLRRKAAASTRGAAGRRRSSARVATNVAASRAPPDPPARTRSSSRHARLGGDALAICALREPDARSHASCASWPPRSSQPADLPAAVLSQCSLHGSRRGGTGSRWLAIVQRIDRGAPPGAVRCRASSGRAAPRSPSGWPVWWNRGARRDSVEPHPDRRRVGAAVALRDAQVPAARKAAPRGSRPATAPPPRKRSGHASSRTRWCSTTICPDPGTAASSCLPRSPGGTDRHDPGGGADRTRLHRPRRSRADPSRSAEHFLTKPVELPALLVILEADGGQRRSESRRHTGNRPRPGRHNATPSSAAAPRPHTRRGRARIADSDRPVLIRARPGQGRVSSRAGCTTTVHGRAVRRPELRQAQARAGRATVRTRSAAPSPGGRQQARTARARAPRHRVPRRIGDTRAAGAAAAAAEGPRGEPLPVGVEQRARPPGGLSACWARRTRISPPPPRTKGASGAISSTTVNTIALGFRRCATASKDLPIIARTLLTTASAPEMGHHGQELADALDAAWRSTRGRGTSASCATCSSARCSSH